MIQEAGAEKVVWTGTEAEVLALIKQERGGPKTGVYARIMGNRDTVLDSARKQKGIVATEASLIENGRRHQPEHL